MYFSLAIPKFLMYSNIFRPLFIVRNRNWRKLGAAYGGLLNYFLFYYPVSYDDLVAYFTERTGYRLISETVTSHYHILFPFITLLQSHTKHCPHHDQTRWLLCCCLIFQSYYHFRHLNLQLNLLEMLFSTHI